MGPAGRYVPGMHPFRFAVQTSTAADGKAWRDRARKCEDLGFSTMYIPDHFGDQWGPIVALTVAAEATTKLNVGALVFDNDYRHPVVLAKEMATLDLVSEGRTELGIGAGWMKTDYEESGMPYDRPGVRIERMVEGLAIMKALWSDGKADFTGKHYTITGAQGVPLPHRRPHMPILIGGGGKKVLSIAAREADIVGVNPQLTAGAVGPEAIASAQADKYQERLGWIKEAAGDRFDQLELQCLTFLVQVVANRAEVLEQMSPMFGLTPEQAATMPIALVGSAEEIAADLRQRREQLGLSYIVIHEGEMDAFAPVVSELAGT